MAKGLQHAGQFIIDELRLVTTNGYDLDLKSSLM